MASRATDALPVFALFAPAFTPATFSRAQLLAVAAILTTGRRTVTNLLRTLGHLVVSGCGHWYKGGAGLVEVRWVYVHDRTGTHRDEYFYTTDLRLMPPEVIEAYAARWKVETTFAEMRSYLDLETTRGWCARTVLRAEPCLFGLYSVVASLYEQLPAESQAEVGVEWEGKTAVTFSDAITAVRRWLWTRWAFEKGCPADPFSKLPEPLRRTLLYALVPAA